MKSSIGYEGHPEVVGTMGQATEGIHLVEDEADAKQLAASGRCRTLQNWRSSRKPRCRLTTSRVVESLKIAFRQFVPPQGRHLLRLPTVRTPSKQIAPDVDVFIGSALGKPNANRLREVAERLGIVLIWWMTKRT